MGKHFFSAEAHTPADDLREALGDAERLVANLRKAGPQVVELLHLLDEIAEALKELEARGMDARAERSRFETVQLQLNNHKGRFLAEAGRAFGEAREAAQPDRVRWWWFVDESLAQERRRKLRRMLIVGAAVVAFLVIAGVVYELFLAPPPEVRQALRHGARGEYLVREEGDWEAALVEFGAASELHPTNPEYWVWIGVLQSKLGDAEAGEEAFASARSLFTTKVSFFLKRAEVYRDLGDLDAAIADTNQAMIEDPDSGWPYYVRHSIYMELEDYQAALADLDKADELAQKAGDVQLEATSRMERAVVIQMISLSPVATPTP